jgi:selenocysteine lyase/cysteine desulfurase
MKTLDYAHIERLTLYAHGKLAQIPGYRPISPLSSGGIISFNIDGASAFDLAALLGKRGICVRAGHHCAQPLHELFGIAGSLRVSFGAYNDTDDIDALGDAIREALEILS